MPFAVAVPKAAARVSGDRCCVAHLCLSDFSKGLCKAAELVYFLYGRAKNVQIDVVVFTLAARVLGLRLW